MPEPNTAITEQPPVAPAVPLSEQEITETYIEQRLEGKTDDLPVPPPGIPEVKPEPPKLVDETPPAPEVAAVQETDSYLDKRKERKDVKRKQRGGVGGVQARIDLLTKEAEEAKRAKAELEEKIKAQVKELATPVEPAKVEEKQPEDAPAVETPATSKPFPRRNEFTKEEEYEAAKALWAVGEALRTNGIATPQPPTIPQPNKAEMQLRQQEFDKFLEKSKLFMASHPDFLARLDDAHIRGLTMTESARVAIQRKAAPEVAYWLANPENDLAARAFMGMDEVDQLIEIGKIIDRLSVSPADFVSSAPPPGTRLSGSNARPEVPLNQINDTDEYIRIRRQQRRARR